MAHDVVIRGGVVVDGTGAPARTADVAIDDGVISEVGRVGGRGRRELHADGAHVLPGWVDIHTHYDGQATWDEELASSSWHGVTTVVMGNCGVGFAPAAPDRHDWLVGLMEGVEDIPGAALAEGISWEWEGFPGYLDALERRRWTVDVGAQVPHGAVRAYVMGDRGARNEAATPDDVAAMAAIVEEAVAAGALGFSTSRTLAHVAVDGEPVPGTFAAEDELYAIGGALGRLGRGVFESAPLGAAGEAVPGPGGPLDEVRWMGELSRRTGRPVTFALLQVDPDPDLWARVLDACTAEVADGAHLRPQVAGRPTGLLSGHQTTYNLLDVIPAYQELRHLPLPELVGRLRRPEVRAAITGWQPDPATAERLDGAYRLTYLMGESPQYEPSPADTVAATAEREGRHPLEVAYDAMLAHEGRAMLYVPILNYSRGEGSHLHTMLTHPLAVWGLGDGGAHVGVICDASMPTWVLTHWVRDRTTGPRLELEWAVHKQTADTARLYGLHDRGVLAPGMLADVNVVDLDGLHLEYPTSAADLPAGGRRLLQRAGGYLATLKAGVATYEGGEPTGELPGRLLRGPRPPSSTT